MTLKDALTLINYIRNSDYKPSEWEVSFMESIGTSNFTVLSYKQHTAFEKIYAKATGGGIYQNRQRIR